MKTIKILTLATFFSLMTIHCSKDSNPDPINSEELITTVKITLTPQRGGTNIILKSKDLDGEGPNAPVVTVSGNLEANKTYDGEVLLLNETETPAKNVTEEVEKEGAEHQFFYQISGSWGSVEYQDEDDNGKPIGIEFTLQTSGPGSGMLTVLLRHEPNKNATGVDQGNIANAGGSTDVEVVFEITVEAS